jgi:hypothetical protein
VWLKLVARAYMQGTEPSNTIVNQTILEKQLYKGLFFETIHLRKGQVFDFVNKPCCLLQHKSIFCYTINGGNREQRQFSQPFSISLA